MAALSKLYTGTRVRMIVGFKDGLGNPIVAPKDGAVGWPDPIEFNDGSIRVWVWWDEGRGSWAPIKALRRLKEKHG